MSLRTATLALALGSAAAATGECADSKDWVHNNRDGLGCDWVAKYAEKRCMVKGNEGGETVTAQDACLAACGMCEEPTTRGAELFAKMCPYAANEFVPPEKKPCEDAFEQSPADITVGAVGTLEPNLPTDPTPYDEIAGKCAVNVHWHLGAEHYNEGTFDIPGKDFTERVPADRRKLAGDVLPGWFCEADMENDPLFAEEYDWQYCEDTHVGYTYEIHWPHSDANVCGYYSDGLAGLFCKGLPSVAGVQGQVFVVVNSDEPQYQLPTLFNGMQMSEGMSIAKYTGSSTGTSHDNEICSPYNVQWHVDRACNMISAKSFDEMCKTMKEVMGMSKDLYPHGSRILVDPEFVSNQPMTRRLRGGKE